MEREIRFRRPAPRKSEGLSNIAKIFFGLNIFQVFVIGGIQGSMMALGDFKPVIQGGMGPGRQVYMGLFMGAVVYSCFLCLFAVTKQNFLEIVAFVMQNYGYIAYSFIQVYHIGFKENFGVKIKKNNYLVVLSIVNSTMLFIMNVIFTLLAVRLYVEYGWKIYKRVRFNVKLRASYHVYELVICLLKMVLLFVWMFAICLNRTVLRNSETSFVFIVSLLSIPLIILVSIAAVFAIRKEIKFLMYTFIAFILVYIAYFGFKMIRVATSTCTGCKEFSMHTEDIPDEVRLHLIYLASVSIIFLLLLLVASYKALKNFGVGLKKHFQGTPHATMMMLSMSRDLLTSIVATSHETMNETDHRQNAGRLSLSNISIPLSSLQPSSSGTTKGMDLMTIDSKSTISRSGNSDKNGNLIERLTRSAKGRINIFNREKEDLEMSQNVPSKSACCCCFALPGMRAHSSCDAYCQTELRGTYPHSHSFENAVCISDINTNEFNQLHDLSSNITDESFPRHVAAHRQISLPSDYPVRTAAVIADRIENMTLGSERVGLSRCVSTGKCHRDLSLYRGVDTILEEKDECYSSYSEDSMEDDDEDRIEEDQKSCRLSNHQSSSNANFSEVYSILSNRKGSLDCKLHSKIFKNCDVFVTSFASHSVPGTRLAEGYINGREHNSVPLRRSKSSIASYSSDGTVSTTLTSTESGDQSALKSTNAHKSERSRKVAILGQNQSVTRLSSPVESAILHTFEGDFLDNRDVDRVHVTV